MSNAAILSRGLRARFSLASAVSAGLRACSLAALFFTATGAHADELCVPIGTYVDLRQLQTAQEKTDAPIIILSRTMYICPCGKRTHIGSMEDRSRSAAIEDRSRDAIEEVRESAASTEVRQNTGSQEARYTMGGGEDRSRRGATEQRFVTGGTEQRQHTGGAERRDHAALAEVRTVTGRYEVLSCTTNHACRSGIQIRGLDPERLRVFNGTSLEWMRDDCVR